MPTLDNLVDDFKVTIPVTTGSLDVAHMLTGLARDRYPYHHIVACGLDFLEMVFETEEQVAALKLVREMLDVLKGCAEESRS
jgi:hypothetical protein